MTNRLRPRLSIVIPTRNRGALIEETLASLLRQDLEEIEVIVVDQSTDGRTREAVQRVAGDDARVVVQPTTSVGSSAARNIGAECSRADFVAYTDDDCIVDERWGSEVLREFDNPRVDAVYGRLLPFEPGARKGTEVGYKAATGRAEFVGRMPPWYIGHGGNMAFRRQSLMAVGGFDPCLGAGGTFGACEDPDIAYRLLASGHRITYAPAVLAYHKHWKDWRAQRRMERNYGIGAGAMFAKYIRCGDANGARLLATWIWQLGVRRTGAGLLKWRSLKTMYLGYCQLVYPWLGMARSLATPVDRRRLVFGTR